MPHIEQDRIAAAGAIKAAKRLVVLTGAGVSAESGVPTFRGPEGLWQNFRPEDLATPEAFQSDPELVWKWYDWRRGLIASVEPNAAHYAIVEMEKDRPGFTLVTQNVDGLHVDAGSRNVIELHGSIWRVRCTGCGKEDINRDVPIDILPGCACGALLRPGVVWFGEGLDMALLQAAFDATDGAEVFITAGTSGVVQPAASLAQRAKRKGAVLVEINTERTPLSPSMDYVLIGKASEILPALL